jgi:hypothetical protein
MMDEPACDYREELTAYLYDECDAAERLRLAAHLETCGACRFELEALQQVRRALGQWAPPERDYGFTLVPRTTAAARPWWEIWRVPLAAAASILVLAGAAGLAHIEVRYGPDGVVVRTGWASASQADAPVAAGTDGTAAAIQRGTEPIALTEPAFGPAAASRRAGALAPPAEATVRSGPWQAELAAFEDRVDQRLNALSEAQPRATVAARLPSQAGLLQQVQSMVQASEQRQQRQFALRLNEAMRELESQRRADLVRIDQSFGQIEGTTGAAVAQQRELWNYLVRVAQHPQ